jgi:hypothetical protein
MNLHTRSWRQIKKFLPPALAKRCRSTGSRSATLDSDPLETLVIGASDQDPFSFIFYGRQSWYSEILIQSKTNFTNSDKF